MKAVLARISIPAGQCSYKPLMKRSVAKRTLNAAMAAKLLTKGKAKGVAIRVDTTMTAATMIAAAMIAVAAIPVVMTSAAMTVPCAATGAMTNKAAQIIKGVAAAMIATTTGAAVVNTILTTLRALMQNHAAPLALDLLSAQEAVPTPRTPTDPANLMSLGNLTAHTYRHITWKKPCPTR